MHVKNESFISHCRAQCQRGYSKFAFKSRWLPKIRHSNYRDFISIMILKWRTWLKNYPSANNMMAKNIAIILPHWKSPPATKNKRLEICKEKCSVHNLQQQDVMRILLLFNTKISKKYWKSHILSYLKINKEQNFHLFLCSVEIELDFLLCTPVEI